MNIRKENLENIMQLLMGNFFFFNHCTFLSHEWVFMEELNAETRASSEVLSSITKKITTHSLGYTKFNITGNIY